MSEERKPAPFTFCAFCLQEFKEEQFALITEHIRECPSHPMRQLERDIKDYEAEVSKLRAANDSLETQLTVLCANQFIKEQQAREEGALSMYDTIRHFWTDNEHGWDALIDKETAMNEWRKRQGGK